LTENSQKGEIVLTRSNTVIDEGGEGTEQQSVGVTAFKSNMGDNMTIGTSLTSMLRNDLAKGSLSDT